MQQLLSAWRRWLPVLLAVFVAAGVPITITVVDDGTGPPEKVTIERKFVPVDPPGPTPAIAVDSDNIEQRDEAREAHDPASQTPDLHEDARDETPPGVTQAEVDAGREQTEALADQVLGDPESPAGAQAYSCPNALVRNRSALAGPRVGTMLHFTVSDPGSLNAIRGLFNTPSFGASSNFGIELNGRCQTWVPRAEKAWAQGAANSAYFSIEIVTKDRTRTQWLAAPIIRTGILAALVRDLNRSIGAPLKHVDPVGCTWTPGITDHDAAECGNTHWDVGKSFPWDVFMKQVRQGVERPITARDRRQCRNVHAYRERRRAGHAGTAAGKTNQARRLEQLRARGVRCDRGRPLRA